MRFLDIFFMTHIKPSCLSFAINTSPKAPFPSLSNISKSSIFISRFGLALLRFFNKYTSSYYRLVSNPFDSLPPLSHWFSVTFYTIFFFLNSTALIPKLEGLIWLHASILFAESGSLAKIGFCSMGEIERGQIRSGGLIGWNCFRLFDPSC